MTHDNHCGGCGGSKVRTECVGSFRRLGLVKVHWECWSDCNLPCAFCYRTLGRVLSTEQAKQLISAIRTAGTETIVFAGGDPSIRPDISTLITFARESALNVEVQTNSHYTPVEFLCALQTVQQVGLSLDGPNAAVHDAFRKKPGNFARVLELLRLLNQWDTPVIVRTLVAKSNYETVFEIGDLLQGMDNVFRWSLLEFSPVGEGFLNRDNYEIARKSFRSATEKARARFPNANKIDIYEAEAKTGTYALITPAGEVYGTGDPTVGGVFPMVGSMLRDHLSVLAEKLPFSKEKHLHRYGGGANANS